MMKVNIMIEVKVAVEEVEPVDKVGAVVGEGRIITTIKIPTFKRRNFITRGGGRGTPNPRYEKSQIQCYNCQKYGHYASECKGSHNKVEEKTNYAQKEGENETLLLARKKMDDVQETSWYLDSGASNHMCGRKNMFVELNGSIGGNVPFGDDSTITVKDKSKILFA